MKFIKTILAVKKHIDSTAWSITKFINCHLLIVNPMATNFVKLLFFCFAVYIKTFKHFSVHEEIMSCPK